MQEGRRRRRKKKKKKKEEEEEVRWKQGGVKKMDKASEKIKETKKV